MNPPFSFFNFSKHLKTFSRIPQIYMNISLYPSCSTYYFCHLLKTYLIFFTFYLLSLFNFYLSEEASQVIFNISLTLLRWEVREDWGYQGRLTDQYRRTSFEDSVYCYKIICLAPKLKAAGRPKLWCSYHTQPHARSDCSDYTWKTISKSSSRLYPFYDEFLFALSSFKA